jgi:hypothetical protein
MPPFNRAEYFPKLRENLRHRAGLFVLGAELIHCTASQRWPPRAESCERLLFIWRRYIVLARAADLGRDLRMRRGQIAQESNRIWSAIKWQGSLRRETDRALYRASGPCRAGARTTGRSLKRPYWWGSKTVVRASGGAGGRG